MKPTTYFTLADLVAKDAKNSERRAKVGNGTCFQMMFCIKVTPGTTFQDTSAAAGRTEYQSSPPTRCSLAG